MWSARRAALAALAAVLAGAREAPAQDPRGRDLTVVGIRFEGNRALDDFLLAASIATSNSSWNYSWFARGLTGWIPFGERRRLDEQEFRRDVVRLQLLYRQHGYFDARVDTVVRRSGGEAAVTFRIDEGPPVLVDSLLIVGPDGDVLPEQLAGNLALRVGQPFDRFRFEASADSLAAYFRDRGYPFIAVYRSYTVDRVERLARVEYAVDPGPLARVGDIVVEGGTRVGEPTVRRALAVSVGDQFRHQALVESQRSLYQTDLFRFASVTVAPDSLVAGSDSLVRIRVRVAESAPAQFRAGAGYGTIDCFRLSGSARLRGVVGGSRLLDITGRLSKLGVGDPADWGLQESLCRELENDPFSNRLNYLLSATLAQPAPLTSRSQISLSATAERRSEFNAYLFESIGTSLSFKYGFGRRVPLSLTYRLARDQTRAEPATYCIYFNQCDPATLDPLRAPLRSASVTASATWTNTDSPFDPTHGHILSLEGTLAARALGSDVVFSRILGEGTSYQRLGGGRTLALRLRGGIVHAGVGSFGGRTLRYVPSSDRFYLGGPTTVRGFPRNEMGPVVYVVDGVNVNPATGDTTYVGLRSSPAGSSALVLGNAEARIPTPVWNRRLALTAYVDAAQLWQELDTEYVPGGLRVTPGIGLQLTTALGPMRLDAAYNGFGSQPGPLYLITGNDLTLVSGRFSRPPRRTFTSRIQWHFSVGLAF